MHQSHKSSRGNSYHRNYYVEKYIGKVENSNITVTTTHPKGFNSKRKYKLRKENTKEGRYINSIFVNREAFYLWMMGFVGEAAADTVQVKTKDIYSTKQTDVT